MRYRILHKFYSSGELISQKQVRDENNKLLEFTSYISAYSKKLELDSSSSLCSSYQVLELTD